MQHICKHCGAPSGVFTRMMREVLLDVAELHSVTLEQIVGHSTERRVVKARKDFANICYYKLGRSLAEIGRVINRDRTTIGYHVGIHIKKRSTYAPKHSA